MTHGPKEATLVEVAALADLLGEPAEHHDPCEKTQPRPNWWEWCAPYIHARQHGSSPDNAANAAALHMEQLRSAGAG
jgi:hypothetical protein